MSEKTNEREHFEFHRQELQTEIGQALYWLRKAEKNYRFAQEEAKRLEGNDSPSMKELHDQLEQVVRSQSADPRIVARLLSAGGEAADEE